MLGFVLVLLILPLLVYCQNATLTTTTLPIEVLPNITTTTITTTRAEPTTLTTSSPTSTTSAATTATTTTTPARASIGCTESDASWLAWSEWSTCSDDCGSCGVHMRTRTCLTTNALCVCEGQSTLIEYCNLEICRYPRSTCCYNLKVTSYNGIFACLGTNSTVSTAARIIVVPPSV